MCRYIQIIGNFDREIGSYSLKVSLKVHGVYDPINSLLSPRVLRKKDGIVYISGC